MTKATLEGPWVHFHANKGEEKIHIWSSPYELGIAVRSDSWTSFSDSITSIKAAVERLDENWLKWLQQQGKEKQE